jgi:hypothetical protein
LQEFNNILSAAQESEIKQLGDITAKARSDAKAASDEADSAKRESGRAKDAASTAESVARGARKEADSFEIDINGAKRDATEAKALVSEIRRLAGEAQEQADRLTRRFADRTLTDAQVLKIANDIIGFQGQEFDITTFWDLREPLAIANRIGQTLATGRWKYVQPKQGGFLLGGISGVQVFVHPAADERVKRAADLLAASLTREGIPAVVKEQNPSNPKDEMIHINVGTKE